jgi:hypothetical protein
MACRAYSEQLGVNLQEQGNIHRTNLWYPSMKAIAARFTILQGNRLAALSPTTVDNFTACARRHPGAETELPFGLDICGGLEIFLHFLSSC